MGYTHSWRRARELDRGKFAAAVADCQKVVKLVAARGVALAGWDGEGTPDIEPAVIAFNGRGGEAYESFAIGCISDARDLPGMRPAGMVFEFCKTAHMPYDVAVVACLVVLKYHLGDAILVTSNGDISAWQDGIEIAALAGVEGAWDFVEADQSDAEEGLRESATLERLEQAV